MPRVARIAFPSLVYHIRDREEQEMREKMARGVIGAEIFQEKIEKRLIDFGGPREAGQENSLYLFFING
jgi:hypothetical protein